MTRARSISTALVVLALASASGSCAYSREGWGRGRFLVVHEAANLQVRRSTIRVDATTGDLVMNWIGARAPAAQPLVAGLSVTVFEDRDGDRAPDPEEIRATRHADGPAEKLLFSDVRVEAESWRVPPGTTNRTPRLSMAIETRTVAGERRVDFVPFASDP